MTSKPRSNAFKACLLVVPFSIVGFKLYTIAEQEKVKVRAARYRILEDSKISGYSPRVYFLSIDNHDPSSSFLSQFNDLGISARKVSQSAAGPFPSELLDVRDMETNERGPVLSVDGLTWRGPFRATIMVGTQGGGGTYVMGRGLGGWSVIGKDSGKGWSS